MKPRQKPYQEWEDPDGDRLLIGRFEDGIRLAWAPKDVEPPVRAFDIPTLTALNEIRQHLDTLAREVFGEEAKSVENLRCVTCGQYEEDHGKEGRRCPRYLKPLAIRSDAKTRPTLDAVPVKDQDASTGQIAAALKYIEYGDITDHHHMANLQALAADYEARGKEIERLQNATACGLCGKSEPYILHLCEDCTDYGYSNTPKESFTMMREIERLKAELKQYQESNAALRADNDATVDEMFGLLLESQNRKHTPGEWVQGKDHQSIISQHPDAGPLTDTERDYYGGKVICETVSACNQPLITTAPKLLAIAECALLCFSNDDEWWTEMAENDCPNNISSDERRRRTLDQLREVIAKAKGEEVR